MGFSVLAFSLLRHSHEFAFSFFSLLFLRAVAEHCPYRGLVQECKGYEEKVIEERSKIMPSGPLKERIRTRKRWFFFFYFLLRYNVHFLPFSFVSCLLFFSLAEWCHSLTLR